MDTLETSCIFRSAYHVCKGADLDRIEVSKNGRRIATFLLRGKGIFKLDKAYRSGEARVNPLQLREALNHVRDQLFKRLKNENTRLRANATPRQEGRMRNDRKRKNRIHQYRR